MVLTPHGPGWSMDNKAPRGTRLQEAHVVRDHWANVGWGARTVHWVSTVAVFKTFSRRATSCGCETRWGGLALPPRDSSLPDRCGRSPSPAESPAKTIGPC